MSPELIPWLAALFFILGFLAMILEILIIPGFGVAGVAGIILVGWGVMLVATDIAHVTSALVLALGVSIILFLGGIKVLSRYKFWTRFTLPARQQSETGYLAPQKDLARFMGQTGVALTPLRPAGAAEIDGQRLDVVTMGDFIAMGSKILVVKVEGVRVVVRLAAQD